MENMEEKSAPNFSLKGSDGKTHELKSYRGKMVILYFYPRDNTSGCAKEACGFRAIHGDLQKRNAVVLGVSRDSLDSHDRFISNFKLPFILLSDPDIVAMTAYGAWGKKTMYGKPVTGTIRSTVVIGPDGRILKHWPKVAKAEQHPAEVLDFIKSLGRPADT
jgi:peroxiredoxin Q/BCP